MSPPRDSTEAAPVREPFFSHWTGVLAACLFAYIPLALLVTTFGNYDYPGFRVFQLYSDSPASIAATIIAAAAAWRATEPAARRTWM
jgi:hypothetical protein